jgi:transcriptional regulator of heat shock response
MQLDPRKSRLFATIVSEYIKTAEPIGSKPLAMKGKLKVSSATIRNEMAELEKAGLICQPYTSAGRVPTEKGWQYYLENILESDRLANKDAERLDKVISELTTEDSEATVKRIAREVAEMVDGAVVVALSPNNVYYTGITNIFRQPEFFHPEMLINMSRVIDHLDAVMDKIFDNVTEPVVWLGEKNPFGREVGAVLTKYRIKKRENVFGILGPVRMDYQRNYNIINYLTRQFNHV